MRIDEPIEKQGFFWPPEYTDPATPGTLRISRSGRVDLDLFDRNTGDDTSDSGARLVPQHRPTEAELQIRPRIHGVVGDQEVTLANCFIRPGKGNIGGGVANVSYGARKVFFGIWEEGDSDLAFTKVTLEIEGLHDWLQFNSLEDTTDYSNNALPNTQQFTYSRPEDIVVHLDSETELTFGLSTTHPIVGKGITQALFKQQSYVTITAPEPMAFQAFLDLATKLQNFLSLAIDQPLNLLSIQAQTPEFTRDGQEVRIDVYADTLELANQVGLIRWHRTLFSYPDVADRIESMLNAWMEHYQKAEPVFNLYFSVPADVYRNIEGEYLAVVQAVEGFHRRFLPTEPKMSKADLKRLKRDAADAVPKEHRELIYTRLQHADEPSLRERIAAMIEPFAKHFGEEAERNDFARDVAKLRNDLSHQIGRPDESPDRLSHLLAMSNRLQALFQMHLLRLLGLDDDRIDDIAERHLEPKLNPQVQRID